MSNRYDSMQDSLDHIGAVKLNMVEIIRNITARAIEHDASKLQSPEKEMYDEYTPKLKELTYATPEYMEMLNKMGPALQHHYQNNDHHPQNTSIMGMNLLSMLEMLADWKAAASRYKDPTSLLESLEINVERFSIPRSVYVILKNTIKELGW